VNRTQGEAPGVTFTRLRLEAGYSIRSLADAASLWPSSVCRVERGDYVSSESRDKLVSVLGPEVRPLIAVRALRTPAPDTAVYRAREAIGVSGRELAERAGVTKDAFYRAERGLPVHPATAKRIADALGLAVVDVLPLESTAA
jgi:transcriptional regulator with XRE-family HTH domain